MSCMHDNKPASVLISSAVYTLSFRPNIVYAIKGRKHDLEHFYFLLQAYFPACYWHYNDWVLHSREFKNMGVNSYSAEQKHFLFSYR